MPTSSHHEHLPKASPGCTRRRPCLLPLFAMAWLLFTLVSPAIGQTAGTTSQLTQQQSLEQHRIDYLIDSVAALKNATFIRNGQTYDAARAAAHMRLKWRFAGSRVKTAEDFIRYCGTASSSSGIKYTISFADGHSLDSASFLLQRLADYRLRNKPGGH